MGSTTARLLRTRGFDLHLVGRRQDRLASLATELGVGCTAGDVTDPSLFERVTQQAGPALDGLVYAVGTIRLRSLARLTAADFLEDFQINALGAALAVRAALPSLKQCPGVSSVVLFSSVAAGQGFPLHASIAMGKGAVSGLTLSLAAELAPKVRVNAIAPSLIRTPLTERLLANQQTAAALAGMHPLQRLGIPADAATLAAFLLSPEADWITGQIVGVDGGRATTRTKS